MNFDITRIMRILPHRAPFLLIDRVTALTPRKSARAIKCVSYNEPFFPGHFPDHPVFPGVLILEAMAQLSGVLAYASEPFDPKNHVLHFVGIDKAKFRTPVRPGDRMVIEVEVIQQRSNIWKTEGTAYVEDNVVAQAELLSAVTERGDEPSTLG